MPFMLVLKWYINGVLESMVHTDPNQRCTMAEAMKMLEEIKVH